jgi:hypothetical protein
MKKRNKFMQALMIVSKRYLQQPQVSQSAGAFLSEKGAVSAMPGSD